MNVFGGLRMAMAAIAMGLALTACATDGSDPSPPSGQDQSELQWAQCMRDNGANVPDPDPNVGGRGEPGQAPLTEDPVKLEKAQKQCEKYAQGGKLKTTDPAEADRQAKYDQCLRDQGITVREDPSGSKVVEETDKDKLEKAARACGGIK
jgi:hypothetical protein